MTIWDYFGIEPTTDNKIIKKAYAAKLKNVNPERDADAFMELRSAYEGLINYIKDLNNNVDLAFEVSDVNSTVNISNDFNESFSFGLVEQHYEVPIADYYSLNYTFPNPVNEFEIAQSLKIKVIDLLASKGRNKNSADSWKEILYDEQFWNLKVKAIFVDELFKIFSEGSPSANSVRLPKNILLMLDDFCQWRERELELYSIYSVEQVNYVLDNFRELSSRSNENITYIRRCLVNLKSFWRDILQIFFLCRKCETPESEYQLLLYLGWVMIMLGISDAVSLIFHKIEISCFNWLIFVYVGFWVWRQKQTFCIFAIISSVACIIHQCFRNHPTPSDTYSICIFSILSLRALYAVVVFHGIHRIRSIFVRDVSLKVFWFGIGLTIIAIFFAYRALFDPNYDVLIVNLSDVAWEKI